MLRFFRINDPYRIIYVFLILVLIRVAWIFYGLPLSLPELKWQLIGERLGDRFIMYRDLYDHTGPLAAFVYKLIDFAFGRNRWVNMGLSGLLITVQAAIVNTVLIRNKAYSENTYLPAFFYVVFMTGVIDFMALSPQLMSLTFILLTLGHIFRRIDNVVTDDLFVYSGLYVGLAAGFYLPSAVFLIAFLLSFILFSSAVMRRILLLIYSVVTVFILIWLYFFWFGAAHDFVNDFFVAGVTKPRIFYISTSDLLKSAVALIGIACLVLTSLFTQRMTNFQQKMSQVMLSFIVSGVIILLITRDLMPADLLFFVPALAFFAVYYVLGIRRKIWRMILPNVIILGAVLYPFWFIKSHPNLDLLVQKTSENPYKGKQLMGIGVDIVTYADYKIAGPFLDEYVSRQKLDNIDYYDEASEIYESLRRSDPELIIDNWDQANKLFYRFPEFAGKYDEVKPGVYLKHQETR